MNLETIMIAGVPLLAVVFGLVEFTKKLGLTGEKLTVVSMVTGLLLGVGYQISVSGLPVEFGAWFGVVVFGLAIGLAASGIYNFIDQRTTNQ